MLIFGWIVALGTLSFLFSGYLDEQHNPNRELRTDHSGQVTLKRNRAGHYIAPGTINGTPVTFLLDTGATMVSIPEPVANRLNLRRGSAGLTRTANGTITTYATTLDSITLGGVRLQDVAAQINPRIHSDEILLGMSFLKRLDFYQQGDTLTIEQ